MDTKQQLLNHLLEEDWIKTPRIIEAFRSIDRKDFVQDETKLLAYFDEALSIGSNQTISQPSVVAFMLEELNPQEGERILDVGAGSGWTSALLAVIVGPRGKVIALDIVSKVVKFGTKNLSKYNFIKRGIVEYICQDADIGYKAKAPFDRILVSAALPNRKLPDAWKEQLRIEGKIVVPYRDCIWVLTKKSEQEFEEKEYPGFVFVPFV
ncbi:MAG: protein-L-isoaspartate O-methyltransferase [Candidatus Wildermuthbacteria bacterium RIFCSPLOWO2_01_FULL_47_18]|uniref:Protein-L-isoaspartate O-methyltransferase n=1 Tax=Candidatus Wildermuthbacteria bacterium RIFCSPLOWO2_01_FULL_47_18 TaxID=1802460 RepID=A0A1G2RGN9_9BACT|nr:MAG: protein-L-isoaspartate O-methyltransferase [Candidatus Wildermuthbacteria bacterium RIFCSPLOWO2_01_FULL_47_18]